MLRRSRARRRGDRGRCSPRGRPWCRETGRDRMRGLTWDHPRGHDALAPPPGRRPRSHWDVQPLEGFESHPDRMSSAPATTSSCWTTRTSARRWKPAACVRWTTCSPPRNCDRWRAGAIGPTMRSYAMDGRQWALPLDAATQVAATRTDLAGEAPPTWDEVRSLARRAPVALSLAGPARVPHLRLRRGRPGGGAGWGAGRTDRRRDGIGGARPDGGSRLRGASARRVRSTRSGCWS